MHPIARIARRIPPVWLAAGPIAAVVCLAACAVAPPVGDAGLIGLAGALGLGTAALWREVARLGSLPLEIAPVVLTGEVDGRPVYRFRVRLGLGRPVRSATATVVFEGDGGALTLPAHVPAGVLVGPFTVLASDLDRRCGSGRFKVVVRADAEGRSWSAETVVAGPATEGRFGGVACRDGRLVFEEDWTART